MFKKWIVTTIMCISAVLVTASYISSLAVVVAETPDDDDVDGEFEITGFNNPLTIVEFQRLAETTNNNEFEIDSTTSFNPTEALRFRLKLHDLDTMNDLHYVEFVFHHVPSGSSITQSFINTTRTSMEGSSAVFRHNISDSFITFIEPDGSNYPNTSDASQWGWKTSDLTNKSEPTMPVAGTTGNSITDTSDSSNSIIVKTEDINNNTAGSIEFSYEISIQISRVAKLAEGENTTSGAWYLGVRIKDGRTPNNSSPSVITVPALAVSTTDPVNEPSTSFTMNWYGEVAASGAMSWLDNLITPGAVDMTTESGLYYDDPNSFKFWSNDSHEITIKSSPTWDVSGDPLARGVTQASIISASTITAPQTFAVRVVERGNGFVNSEFLTSNELTLFTPEETSATDEGGFTLFIDGWLGLAEEFQNGTYTGTITFTIKNP